MLIESQSVTVTKAAQRGPSRPVSHAGALRAAGGASRGGRRCPSALEGGPSRQAVLPPPVAGRPYRPFPESFVSVSDSASFPERLEVGAGCGLPSTRSFFSLHQSAFQEPARLVLSLSCLLATGTVSFGADDGGPWCILGFHASLPS